MGSLFIDCSNGARKGALAGALLGLLEENARDEFIEDFDHIGLPGVSCKVDLQVVGGHECQKFLLLDDGRREQEGDDGHLLHHGRHVEDVADIIDSLRIDPVTAKDALKVYEVLAQAEAMAHDLPVQEVHFHEVGNNFAIGSIVAFCMIMNHIKPACVVSTSVTTGFGFVECAHGRIAIPAPATRNVLSLAGIPHVPGKAEGELSTPTGAAIIATFAQKFLETDIFRGMLSKEGEMVTGYGIDDSRLSPIAIHETR